MRKTLFLGLGSLVAAFVSLPLFAAFEAHVINVTAKIENAIRATPSEITFGTVFPQEKFEKPLTISLSESFREQSRVSLVYYAIRQKPKCVDAQGNYPQVAEDARGNFLCPSGSTMMPLLCPYLSKTSPKSGDQSVKPFHGSITNWTLTDTLNWEARGVIDTSDPERDASTTWTIDFKVPCFADMCAQDWEKFVTDNGPAGVVPSNYIQPAENEHQIFGCDLWVETIRITTEPSPSFCGDGAIQQPNGTGVGGPNNDGNEQCDTYDIVYQGQGYHCGADCTISRCQLGQVRPCHVDTQDGISRGLQGCTEEGLWDACEIIPPPILSEITPVPDPTSGSTPSYTFHSTAEGAIAWDGLCRSQTTNAVVGNNTVVFDELADGYYDSCTLRVQDAAMNISQPLQITPFIIHTGPGPIRRTVTLWENFNPDTDLTPGEFINVSGYTEAVLDFDWHGGGLTHTCQYAYHFSRNGVTDDLYSTFLFFPSSGCQDTARIPLVGVNFLKIDSWTPPSGILNATLTLIKPASPPIVLWDNFTPATDQNDSAFIDVSGFTTARLDFYWYAGTLTHTCQFAYQYSTDGVNIDFDSTFQYFPSNGCQDFVEIPLNGTNFLRISSWTPPSGILFAGLTLSY